MPSADHSDYVLGHSESELARLARQAEFFSDQTEQIFRAAGLREGMNVLDIGCGVGDVSMIAGRIVGRSGSVLGLDRSQEALDLARERMDAAGLDFVQFAQGDIGEFESERPFDAAIGRFILLHMQAPDEILRRVQHLLKPDGVLAFAEMDIRSTAVTPPMPLLEQCLAWIVGVYERSGLEPDMGSRLYYHFRRAGFQPNLSSSCRIEGGANRAGFSFVAETIRSMLPALIKLGVVEADAVGVDTLAERLIAAGDAGDHCIVFPRLIGAWARAGDTA